MLRRTSGQLTTRPLDKRASVRAAVGRRPGGAIRVLAVDDNGVCAALGGLLEDRVSHSNVATPSRAREALTGAARLTPIVRVDTRRLPRPPRVRGSLEPAGSWS